MSCGLGIDIPRPPEAVCKHPGMPSGHVMNAYTLMVWCFLEAALDRMVHPEWLAVIVLVLGPVPWARVYNKDSGVARVWGLCDVTPCASADWSGAVFGCGWRAATVGCQMAVFAAAGGAGRRNQKQRVVQQAVAGGWVVVGVGGWRRIAVECQRRWEKRHGELRTLALCS